MQVIVDAYYTGYISTGVELPEGYCKEDIKDVYIRWHEGVIVFLDGTEQPFELDNEDPHIDWKRPSDIDVLQMTYD